MKLAHMSSVPRLLMFWLCIGVLLSLMNNLIWLRHPYTYLHGWHASDLAIMARSFNNQGVLALHGVPIRNNPPMGKEPDAYIHWPPLSAILLSFVFRIFGESEASFHGWSIALLLAFCLTLYALVRTCYGVREGLFTVFAALTMPVTVIYTISVGNAFLYISAMLLALLGFIKATEEERSHRGWALFGVGSLVLGVLTSWFALTLPPGLLAIALWQRNRSKIRLALLYNIVGAVTAAGVMTLFLFNSPGLADDLWHTLIYRTGIAPFRLSQFHVHTLSNESQYSDAGRQTLPRMLWQYADNFMLMLGALPALAGVWVLIAGWSHGRRRINERAALLFGGLFAPWLLWFAIMLEHASAHDIAMQIAVPACAAAMGVGVVKLIDVLPHVRDKSMQWTFYAIILVILPVVMLIPLLKNLDERRQNFPWDNGLWFYYARDIKEATGPEAIVLVPMDTMMTVYYSERHVIRGVLKDSLVEKVVSQLPEVFPGSPAYLAIPNDKLEFPEFSQSMKKYQLVKRTKNLSLYAITNDESSPGRDANIR